MDTVGGYTSAGGWMSCPRLCPTERPACGCCPDTRPIVVADDTACLQTTAASASERTNRTDLHEKEFQQLVQGQATVVNRVRSTVPAFDIVIRGLTSTTEANARVKHALLTQLKRG